jgi:hypothetical protein
LELIPKTNYINLSLINPENKSGVMWDVMDWTPTHSPPGVLKYGKGETSVGVSLENIILLVSVTEITWPVTKKDYGGC